MRHLRGIISALAVGLLALTGCSTGAKADASAQTRTVTDAAGASVEVPAEPQRVVVLHYAGTQAMLDLGLTPVGHGVLEENNAPEEYIKALADVPVIVDEAMAPDIEKISSLEPDLILAPNITEPDALTQLGKVAPVYQWTLRGKDRAGWDQRVKEIADALGRTQQYETLRTDFQQRLEDTKKKYADVIDGKTVGILSAYTENNMYIWGEKNMQGSLLTPLGFTWSAAENKAVADQSEPEAEVSAERVGEVFGDADVIFYDTNFHDETSPFLTKIQDGPLYRQLPAVTAGHTFPFGKTTIAGYADAGHSLDKIIAGLDQMR